MTFLRFLSLILRILCYVVCTVTVVLLYACGLCLLAMLRASDSSARVDSR